MAIKLKVFTWSDGFRAHTIATGSRAKALKAWGLNRDLFKDGYAREIHDGPDFDRAMADPGVVIDRGESIDARQFKAHPSSKPKRVGGSKAAPERPKGPDPKDVRLVAQLKADLVEQDKAHAKALENLDDDIAALEAKRRDLRREGSSRRTELKRKLAEAEQKLKGALK